LLSVCFPDIKNITKNSRFTGFLVAFRGCCIFLSEVVAQI
jgi:hypothetical protein